MIVPNLQTLIYNASQHVKAKENTKAEELFTSILPILEKKEKCHLHVSYYLLESRFYYNKKEQLHAILALSQAEETLKEIAPPPELKIQMQAMKNLLGVTKDIVHPNSPISPQSPSTPKFEES